MDGKTYVQDRKIVKPALDIISKYLIPQFSCVLETIKEQCL